MQSKPKHYWLYVLKLEQGKYYVGITSQTPETRFQEHLGGTRSSYWTQQYKPIEIFDTKDLGYITISRAKKYEERVTRKYMRRHGINSTRGGDLTDKFEYGTILGTIYLKDAQQAVYTIVFLLFVIAVLAWKIYT